MFEERGSLADVGLGAAVQLLGELRETGRLHLTTATTSADLYFEAGVLVAAACGDKHGQAALLHAALHLSAGDFIFVRGERAAERTLALRADEVLEHLRDLAPEGDEVKTLPPLDSIPRLAGQPGTFPADQLVLDRAAVQLLLEIDNRRSVRQIVGSRPLIPALSELAVLADQGLITFTAPQVEVAPATPLIPVAGTQPLTTSDEPGVCPKLGYADDPSRHYPRPTALHRCYASGASLPVSSQEQRELCLGGHYTVCARYLSAPQATPSAPVPPPRVAARLTAAARMTTTDQPVRRRAAPPMAPIPPAGRMPLLIAAGGVVTLLLVAAAWQALPMLRAPLEPAPRTPATGFVALAATSIVPTPLPKPSPASTLSVRPQPTAAVAAQAPSPTTRPGFLEARFNGGPQKDWLENPPYVGWSDGAYRLQGRQATRFVAIAAPVAHFKDVIVSATLRKTGGPPGGGYGLIVRDQSPETRNGVNQDFDGYVFEAGDLGEFGVWRREDDHWIDLVPWTRSAAVRAGGSPNELSVATFGPQITLTINGIEVARVEDDVLQQGGVGIFVGGDFNQVALDRFSVESPD